MQQKVWDLWLSKIGRGLRRLTHKNNPVLKGLNRNDLQNIPFKLKKKKEFKNFIIPLMNERYKKRYRDRKQKKKLIELYSSHIIEKIFVIICAL
jgi:hypothetical protein